MASLLRKLVYWLSDFSVWFDDATTATICIVLLKKEHHYPNYVAVKFLRYIGGGMPKVKGKRKSGSEEVSVVKKSRTNERNPKAVIVNGCARDKHDTSDACNPKVIEQRRKQWFNKYAEGEEMGPEGVEKFCYDLGVQPEDIVMLVIAWHMKAKRMGYFTRTEWMEGLQQLQVGKLDELKGKLDNLRSELDDPIIFKDIYKYSYDFAKDKDQRSMDLELAIGMLTLLLASRWNLYADFITYLKEQGQYKVINRDQWVNILEFSRTISADLSNYDVNGAWPVLLDEYVEWQKARNGGDPIN